MVAPGLPTAVRPCEPDWPSRAIEPSLYDAALPRTLLVSVLEEPDDNILLQRHMTEHGVHCTTAHLPGPTVWIEDGDFGTSGMPVDALKGIVSWVTG